MRKRTLRRLPKVRSLGDDFQWLWAAYKNGEGGFAPEIFAPGLSQEDFKDHLDRVLQRLDEVLIMEAKHPTKGMIPMGLASMAIVENFVMPHFDWFWWASPRNKLECAVKFFLKHGEDVPFFIAVPAKTEVHRFLGHLARYQVVKKVGISDNWAKEPTALFESKPCLV